MCDPKNKQTCGKCSSNDHQTKDCFAEEEDYKCAHCEENHITGSYSCSKMKEKLGKLVEDREYGS